MIVVVKRVYALLGIVVGLVFGLVILFQLYNPILQVKVEAAQFAGQIDLDIENGKRLVREIKKSTISSKKANPEPYSYLIVNRKKGSEKYIISRDNKVYDTNGKRVFTTEKFIKIFGNIRMKLNKMGPFGQMVSWTDADKLFPRYARAIVQDIDTGLSFEVQRRAGSAHADVQPVSAEDTKIMKQIYGGRWSWKRKAIAVKVQGRKLAASMNGMPHGAGAIGGNMFPGHFCIHFFDCKTHTGNVNLAHQVMVWKAADRFPEMTDNLDLKKAVQVFFTTVDQGEHKLAQRFIKFSKEQELKEVMKLIKSINWLTVIKSEEPINGKDQSSVYIELKIGFDTVQQKSQEGSVNLLKNQGSPNWKIEARSLLELLNKD